MTEELLATVFASCGEVTGYSLFFYFSPFDMTFGILLLAILSSLGC